MGCAEAPLRRVSTDAATLREHAGGALEVTRAGSRSPAVPCLVGTIGSSCSTRAVGLGPDIRGALLSVTLASVTPEAVDDAPVSPASSGIVA